MDHSLNLEVIERWKSFFDSSGIDLFEAIEAGIKVAVWYEPDEFLIRRDQIAELLFKKKGDARGSIRSCFEKPQTLVSDCQNKDHCSTTGSPVECDDTKHLWPLWESASMLHGSSSNEKDAYSNIIKLPKSCSRHEEQVCKKPEPILVSTCKPAETSKTEEDKPKTRRIIKIKPHTIHKSGKQFANTEDEGPLKRTRKGDEAYQICCQTKTPMRESLHESANPKPFQASASVFSKTSMAEDDLFSCVTRNAEMLVSCRKGKQFQNLGHVQNAREKSLKQSTGRRVNNGERVQEKKNPNDNVLALEAACIPTDTPKIKEDKPETRRIVDMGALKLGETGKKLQTSENVQNEEKKSLQQSNSQSTESDSPRVNIDGHAVLSEMIQALCRNYKFGNVNESDTFLPRVDVPGIIVPLRSYKGSSRDDLYGGMSEDPEEGPEAPAMGVPARQHATRNAELLLRCGKGKQLDLGHFRNAPEKSLKQSTRERVSDGELVQQKPKPSNMEKEAIELRLKASKRKLREGYEQALNARKKIQVVEFKDLPQKATTCAKTQRAKEHMRSQKTYTGCFKR